LALALSGGFPELGAENVNCHNYGPGCLVHRCPGWSIPGHEVAQFHCASAQSVKGFEAFKKPLARANGSESPSASEAVAGGNVTPLNGFCRLTPGSVQAGADVAGKGNDAGHRFEVRLVMVADDSVRSHAGTTQGTTEESFCTGAVSLIAQQNIDELAVLINLTIEVAFLFAAKAKHFIHVPSPSPPSPVALDCFGQLRAEGLHPIEYRTRRDIDMALR
jgi:hypothetical protein